MSIIRGNQGALEFREAGNSGQVLEVATVRSWSLSIEKEALEHTSQGDYSRKFVGGLVSGTGTCEVLYDASGENTITYKLLREAVIQKDTAGAYFNLCLDQEEGKMISFSALITGADYSATVGEIEVITISFNTSGNIVMAT